MYMRERGRVRERERAREKGRKRGREKEDIGRVREYETERK